MENYNIESLNEEQLKALYQTEGAVLVTAGAGSGKTRLLTHRIIYLLREMRVSPHEILAITFTNKAANEMRERVIDMDPSGASVWISTFHSMCAKMLRMHIDRLEGYTKNFTIYSEQDKDRLVRDLFIQGGDKDNDALKKKFSFHVSNWKNSGIRLEEYIREIEFDSDAKKIGVYIAAYENKLKENNALDFDDLLIKTELLFSQCPDILNNYAQRFKYVLVDEFQDTNKIQYELVKKLSGHHKNVFVVGDEDQCIYTWRGANFENIFKFTKDYEKTQTFKLERNYRSTKNILEVANKVIKNNNERLEKKLWTDRDAGDEPEIYFGIDDRDEALYVAKKINELMSRGTDYGDMVILMRLNALSRPFEEALLSYNIPYEVYGGFKFFERAEIKNVISYLRLFVNPKDDVSFLRIINFPKRGIGDGALDKLREHANGKSLYAAALDIESSENSALIKKFQPFAELMKELTEDFETLPLEDVVENVIHKSGMRAVYKTGTEEDANKLLNLDSLLESVRDFSAKNPLLTLTDYLEGITLMSDIDNQGQKSTVSIATVHSMKGLEFKTVFVVGVEEGIFPVMRAFSSKADLEEERRLMYVAITRAKERLFITNSSKRFIYGGFQYQTPSRFIGEMGMTKPKPKFEPIFQKKNEYDIKMFKPTAEKKEENRKDVSVFKAGQLLQHPRFGKGKLLTISADGLVGDIEFDGVGVKSLMLDIAPLEIIG